MAKKVKEEVPANASVILNLNPDVILADDNTRFSLKDSRIDSLAKSIMQQGGVIEPVEVQPLGEAAQNGHSYRLTMGFYRLAAVKRLNEQGAGLTIPAMVHTTEGAKERLVRQLTENIERESLSPIDQALAIKKLFDLGYSRIEVREMFSRPGGRKGNKVQPVSNSWLNLTTSLLDLPKAIQTKIHEGTVNVWAAYELAKVPKDKQEAILQRAEQDRVDAFEKEEREEKKIVEAQAKAEEADKKHTEALSALDKVKESEAKAIAELEACKVEVDAAFELKKIASKTEKKDAEKAFKQAEIKLDGAKGMLETVTKEREALEKKQVGAAKLLEEKAAKLKEIREGRKGKPAGAAKAGTAVSGSDVKNAVAREGSQPVKLNYGQAREAIEELVTPLDGNKKVKLIGAAILKCFDGVSTPDQMYRELEVIVKG